MATLTRKKKRRKNCSLCLDTGKTSFYTSLRYQTVELPCPVCKSDKSVNEGVSSVEKDFGVARLGKECNKGEFDDKTTIS